MWDNHSVSVFKIEKLNNYHSMVFSIFVDLKRAFETINRNVLIEKLEIYGMPSVALEFKFKDYLSNRYATTRIKKILSTSGIPQASVTEPISFIFYIDDLQRVLKINSCVN